jgi:hypothetical protein
MLIGGKIDVSWEDPIDWYDVAQEHVVRSFNVPAVTTMYEFYTAEFRRHCPLLFEIMWKARCALPTPILVIETHFSCSQH